MSASEQLITNLLVLLCIKNCKSQQQIVEALLQTIDIKR